MSIRFQKFSETDIADSFFTSLKSDYPGFEEWFRKKSESGESAFVFRDSAGALGGFLYLKVEDGPVLDVMPTLHPARRVKLGTMKIDAHGTKLGERFIKKAIDWALDKNATEIYVTVFPKHISLISLLERYGFAHKSEKSGEKVLLKRIGDVSGDIEKDYPAVSASGSAFLISVYPIWHTRLFPDSKLSTEGPELILDVSHTNSIHKVYLCNMAGVERLKPGDSLVIYRTKEVGKVAEYSAVATSICVVEDYRDISSFSDAADFLRYAAPYSVFSNSELSELWSTRKYPKVIRFAYNFSLRKRLIRKKLVEEIGLPRNEYWGFMPISVDQLRLIAKLGGIDESLIVSKA